MSLVLDLTEANLRLVVVIVLYAFTLVFWAFRSETRSLLAISFLYPYSSTLCLSLSLSRSVFSRSIYIHFYLLCILFYICRPYIYIYIDIFVINCLFDFFPSNRTQLNLNFSTTTRIEKYLKRVPKSTSNFVYKIIQYFVKASIQMVRINWFIL